MEEEPDAVEQERFVIDAHILAALVEGVHGTRWERKTGGATVSTIHETSPELRAAIRSLAGALVQVGKIRREEDSGNIVRAEGPCSLSISEFTHIVPITISGSLPTISRFSLAMETITHVKQGKIYVKPGSIVCFSFYSELPDKLKTS